MPALNASQDLRFVLEDRGNHPDILGGVFPTYLSAGLSFTGLKLKSDNITDLRFILSFGAKQRTLWQDCDTGEPIPSDMPSLALRYNVFVAGFTLKFSQGFLKNPVPGKTDLFKLVAGYSLRFESAFGQRKFLSWTLKSNMDYMLWDDYDGYVFPDLRGNRKMLANELFLALILDRLESHPYSSDGIYASVGMAVSPECFNKALDGRADYFDFHFSFLASKTLVGMYGRQGNILTITIGDRFCVEELLGSMIPAFVKGSASLGRKMRGYDNYTYNTEFTVVNNIDLRILGPTLGVNGLFPRITVFFDVGYAGGKVLNTLFRESDFLCSTGAIFDISIFGVLDLGYQIAYLISGEKFSQKGKFTHGIFFGVIGL